MYTIKHRKRDSQVWVVPCPWSSACARPRVAHSTRPPVPAPAWLQPAQMLASWTLVDILSMLNNYTQRFKQFLIYDAFLKSWSVQVKQIIKIYLLIQISNNYRRQNMSQFIVTALTYVILRHTSKLLSSNIPHN